MLKNEVMQQQQKAQKLGNQRKSINSYTNKKKKYGWNDLQGQINV